jgi:alkanesulfonate monooxygenase SsuD/methylene tetrahydromethanopterin reductase-like flavin-dependent oxidoreductase (luciferase family)
MKFGLYFQVPCTAEQSPARRFQETIEQAVYGETLGFESVWPVEQHFNAAVSILPTPGVLLGAIAARTQKMILGTAVLLVPLTHPLKVAEEAAVLDVISGGRMELGVGRGSLAQPYEAFDISQDESRERLLEGIELIRAAWQSPVLNFEGKYYKAHGLAVTPQPIQPRPVVRIAANTPESFVVAGQRGLPTFAGSNVNAFGRLRELIPTYWRARGAAGIAPSGDEVTLLMPVFVGDNSAAVRRDIEASVRQFFLANASFPAANEWIKQVLERFRNTTYEEAAENHGIFGTATECVARISALRHELKISRIICGFDLGGLIPHDKIIRSMEIFQHEVVPRLD